LDDLGIRDVDHKTRQQKKRTGEMKKKYENITGQFVERRQDKDSAGIERLC
jgi:hypothetical protein